MLRRAKFGVGIAAIGMALSVAPVVSASASVRATAGDRSVAAVRSVDALQTSSLCKDYKSQQKSLANTQGSALAKAYASGKWSEIQKALLTSFGSESGAVKALESVLSGAPSNVKNAVKTFLNFENSLKTDIQQSNSIVQFGQKAAATEESPKLQAALKTVEQWGVKKCGGSIPKTPTT